MANVVKDKANDSQPVPVSDDEDSDVEEHSQNSTTQISSIADNSDNQATKFDELNGQLPVIDNDSPRQNSISPASSLRDSASPNELTGQNEKATHENNNGSTPNDQNVDNVSVENGGEEETENINSFVPVSNESLKAEDYYDGHNEDVENVSVSPSGSPREDVVDDIGIAKEINEYVKLNRINWAEIEHLEDLWAICDAISAAHSGLPDSLLKDSFLIVLQGHLTKNKMAWIRQHLDYLVKLWKKEVQSEKPTQRPTKFVAACMDYTPPIVVKKPRSNADRKRALKHLMSVGDILQHARQRFATEDGELDVEEDEDGAFTIGGQELSFETWAEINRIKDDGVVYNPEALAKTKRPRKRRTAAVVQQHEFLQQKQFLQQQEQDSTLVHGPSAAPSSSSSATVVFSAGKNTLQSNGGEKNSLKQEKDEGELSESDESAEASDSVSSASSSDEDGVSATSGHAKSRRKKRRESQRQTGASSISNVNEIMQKAFQYRFQIVQALTIQQKAAFLGCLKS